MTRTLLPKAFVSLGAVGVVLVVLAGCGGSHTTSNQPASLATPRPPSANASPYLTRAGYAALRDTVALGKTLERTSASFSSSALAKLRTSCAHIGSESTNSQVKAQRAQCTASAEELNTDQALSKCPQATDPAAARSCFVNNLQRFSAVLHREVNLDDELVAAVAAGPCRNLLLAGYGENVRLAQASDQAAGAIQTAKTANDVTGPLQAWQRALAAMIATSRREAPTLKRQYTVCRPR